MKRILQIVFYILLCLHTACAGCFVFAHAEDAPSAGSGYAYPEPNVMQLDIVMHPSNYLKMIETPKTEAEYLLVKEKTYDAAVSIDNGAWQNVGIHLCGHSSLEFGFSHPAKRLPLEIRFDHTDPDGSFHGNPSLRLINCPCPAMMFAQIVATETYRFMDIPTPEMAPVFIRINGEDFGTYLATEEINESFVKKHYDGTGSLYKGSSGTEPVYGFHAIKTNIDRGNETLEALSTALLQGEPIDSLLNIDKFLRYLACESFTLDFDGFFSLHNFYLYDDHGEMVALPWDKNCSFDIYEMYLRGSFYLLDPVEQQANPIWHYLLDDPAYEARYLEYVQKLNDVFLDPDVFTEWLDRYIHTVSRYLQDDPTINLYSPHIYEDLTTGSQLYNGEQGNLLLSFKTIHTQLRERLQNGVDTVYIPDGCTFGLQYEPQETLQTRLHGASLIRRICTGYWKLRREFYWQEYGTATISIGSIFAVFFCIAIVSTHISKGGFRYRKKREDVWNE